MNAGVFRSSLSGKTALVTGGGTGIGLGIVQSLTEAGCHVAISGRREETLREASESISSDFPILFCAADVADREDAQQLVAWANKAMGQVDILVCSAGVNIKTRTMAEMTPEQWDHVIGVNVTGVYNCMYAVLPQMRERKDGLIINIASIAGLRASSLGGVAYNASKFAMGALGTSVGNELRDSGVRVTTVYPGEVNTPLLDFRPVKVSDDHKAAILQPEDVGDLVLAIASLPARAHVPDVVIKPTIQEFH